jgi:hypothetical protein
MSGNGTLNLEMKETNYVHFSSPEPDAFLFAFPLLCISNGSFTHIDYNVNKFNMANSHRFKSTKTEICRNQNAKAYHQYFPRILSPQSLTNYDTCVCFVYHCIIDLLAKEA